MATFSADPADPQNEEPTSSASSSDWSDEEGDEYLAKALASNPYLQGTPVRDDGSATSRPLERRSLDLPLECSWLGRWARVFLFQGVTAPVLLWCSPVASPRWPCLALPHLEGDRSGRANATGCDCVDCPYPCPWPYPCLPCHT